MVTRLSAFFIKIVYFFQGVIAPKLAACPYCKSSRFEVVSAKGFVIQVCFCKDCYLYWMNPIFAFPFFYDLLYREKGIAAVTSLKKAQNIIRYHSYDEHIDSRPIIRLLARMVPGRRLLEVGCSWGYFLAQAQEQEFGFHATGVEVSEKRRKLAKKIFGLTVVPSAQELIAQQKTFDVIYCRQTLEHLGDYLRTVFSDMHALLAADGVVVIEVPRLHPERGKQGFRIMGAVHPFGFTREFFLKNMPLQGFSVTVQNSYSEEDMDWFLVVILKKRG